MVYKLAVLEILRNLFVCVIYVLTQKRPDML